MKIKIWPNIQKYAQIESLSFTGHSRAFKWIPDFQENVKISEMNLCLWGLKWYSNIFISFECKKVDWWIFWLQPLCSINQRNKKFHGHLSSTKGVRFSSNIFCMLRGCGHSDIWRNTHGVFAALGVYALRTVQKKFLSDHKPVSVWPTITNLHALHLQKIHWITKDG